MAKQASDLVKTFRETTVVQPDLAPKDSLKFTSKSNSDLGNGFDRFGRPKTNGWRGKLKLGGKLKGTDAYATEYTTQSGAIRSLDGPIGEDGKRKQIDFPSLVPTLTKAEADLMINDIIPNDKHIPEPIMQKAIDFALEQRKKGESFYPPVDYVPETNEPLTDELTEAVPETSSGGGTLESFLSRKLGPPTYLSETDPEKFFEKMEARKAEEHTLTKQWVDDPTLWAKTKDLNGIFEKQRKKEASEALSHVQSEIERGGTEITVTPWKTRKGLHFGADIDIGDLKGEELETLGATKEEPGTEQYYRQNIATIAKDTTSTPEEKEAATVKANRIRLSGQIDTYQREVSQRRADAAAYAEEREFLKDKRGKRWGRALDAGGVNILKAAVMPFSPETSRAWHLASQSPAMAYQNEDWLDWVINTPTETLPYILATSVTAAATGGASIPATIAAFSVGSMVEGVGMYHEMLDRGVDPALAKTLSLIGGPISGGIEAFTFGGTGKFHQSFTKIFSSKVSLLKHITGETVKNAWKEAAQESLQELTTLSALKIGGVDVSVGEAANRTFQAGFAGAMLGFGMSGINVKNHAEAFGTQGVVDKILTKLQTEYGFTRDEAVDVIDTSNDRIEKATASLQDKARTLEDQDPSSKEDKAYRKQLADEFIEKMNSFLEHKFGKDWRTSEDPDMAAEYAIARELSFKAMEKKYLEETGSSDYRALVQLDTMIAETNNRINKASDGIFYSEVFKKKQLNHYKVQAMFPGSEVKEWKPGQYLMFLQNGETIQVTTENAPIVTPESAKEASGAKTAEDKARSGTAGLFTPGKATLFNVKTGEKHTVAGKIQLANPSIKSKRAGGGVQAEASTGVHELAHYLFKNVLTEEQQKQVLAAASERDPDKSLEENIAEFIEERFLQQAGRMTVGVGLDSKITDMTMMGKGLNMLSSLTARVDVALRGKNAWDFSKGLVAADRAAQGKTVGLGRAPLLGKLFKDSGPVTIDPSLAPSTEASEAQEPAVDKEIEFPSEGQAAKDLSDKIEAGHGHVFSGKLIDLAYDKASEGQRNDPQSLMGKIEEALGIDLDKLTARQIKLISQFSKWKIDNPNGTFKQFLDKRIAFGEKMGDFAPPAGSAKLVSSEYMATVPSDTLIYIVNKLGYNRFNPGVISQATSEDGGYPYEPINEEKYRKHPGYPGFEKEIYAELLKRLRSRSLTIDDLASKLDMDFVGHRFEVFEEFADEFEDRVISQPDYQSTWLSSSLKELPIRDVDEVFPGLREKYINTSERLSGEALEKARSESIEVREEEKKQKWLVDGDKDFGYQPGTYLQTKPSGVTLTEEQQTKKFNKWFTWDWINNKPGTKRSAVVDNNGNPLPVYHGTTANFNSFSDDRKGFLTRSMSARFGFFFTDDPSVATKFTQFNKIVNRSGHITIKPAEDMDAYVSGANVKKVFLSMTNAKEVGFEEVAGHWGPFVKKTKKEGYDGIIVTDMLDLGGIAVQYVVFDKHQIKSAISNTGEYAVDNADITAKIVKRTKAELDEIATAPDFADRSFSPERVLDIELSSLTPTAKQYLLYKYGEHLAKEHSEEKQAASLADDDFHQWEYDEDLKKEVSHLGITKGALWYYYKQRREYGERLMRQNRGREQATTEQASPVAVRGPIEDKTNKMAFAMIDAGFHWRTQTEIKIWTQPIMKDGKPYTRSDGSVIHASRLVDNSIQLDIEGLKEDFKNKAWMDPKPLKDGTVAEALPVNAFVTEEEYINYVAAHEIAHVKQNIAKEGKKRRAESEAAKPKQKDWLADPDAPTGTPSASEHVEDSQFAEPDSVEVTNESFKFLDDVEISKMQANIEQNNTKEQVRAAHALDKATAKAFEEKPVTEKEWKAAKKQAGADVFADVFSNKVFTFTRRAAFGPTGRVYSYSKVRKAASIANQQTSQADLEKVEFALKGDEPAATKRSEEMSRLERDGADPLLIPTIISNVEARMKALFGMFWRKGTVSNRKERIAKLAEIRADEIKKHRHKVETTPLREMAIKILTKSFYKSEYDAIREKFKHLKGKDDKYDPSYYSLLQQAEAELGPKLEALLAQELDNKVRYLQTKLKEDSTEPKERTGGFKIEQPNPDEAQANPTANPADLELEQQDFLDEFGERGTQRQADAIFKDEKTEKAFREKLTKEITRGFLAVQGLISDPFPGTTLEKVHKIYDVVMNRMAYDAFGSDLGKMWTLNLSNEASEVDFQKLNYFMMQEIENMLSAGKFLTSKMGKVKVSEIGVNPLLVEQGAPKITRGSIEASLAENGFQPAQTPVGLSEDVTGLEAEKLSNDEYKDIASKAVLPDEGNRGFEKSMNNRHLTMAQAVELVIGRISAELASTNRMAPIKKGEKRKRSSSGVRIRAFETNAAKRAQLLNELSAITNSLAGPPTVAKIKQFARIQESLEKINQELWATAVDQFNVVDDIMKQATKEVAARQSIYYDKDTQLAYDKARSDSKRMEVSIKRGDQDSVLSDIIGGQLNYSKEESPVPANQRVIVEFATRIGSGENDPAILAQFKEMVEQDAKAASQAVQLFDTTLSNMRKGLANPEFVSKAGKELFIGFKDIMRQVPSTEEKASITEEKTPDAKFQEQIDWLAESVIQQVQEDKAELRRLVALPASKKDTFVRNRIEALRTRTTSVAGQAATAQTTQGQTSFTVESTEALTPAITRSIAGMETLEKLAKQGMVDTQAINTIKSLITFYTGFDVNSAQFQEKNETNTPTQSAKLALKQRATTAAHYLNRKLSKPGGFSIEDVRYGEEADRKGAMLWRVHWGRKTLAQQLIEVQISKIQQEVAEIFGVKSLAFRRLLYDTRNKDIKRYGFGVRVWLDMQSHDVTDAVTKMGVELAALKAIQNPARNKRNRIKELERNLGGYETALEIKKISDPFNRIEEITKKETDEGSISPEENQSRENAKAELERERAANPVAAKLHGIIENIYVPFVAQVREQAVSAGIFTKDQTGMHKYWTPHLYDYTNKGRIYQKYRHFSVVTARAMARKYAGGFMEGLADGKGLLDYDFTAAVQTGAEQMADTAADKFLIEHGEILGVLSRIKGNGYEALDHPSARYRVYTKASVVNMEVTLPSNKPDGTFTEHAQADFNVQQEALRKQEAEKAGRPYTPLPKPVNKKGRKIVQKNDGPGRIARLVEVDGVIHAQVRHQVTITNTETGEITKKTILSNVAMSDLGYTNESMAQSGQYVDENGKIFTLAAYYAPAQFARNFNRAFRNSKFEANPFISNLMSINNTMKEVQLLFGMFHQWAFSRSAVLGGSLGWKGLNVMQVRRDGFDAIMEMGPQLRLLMSKGMTLARIQDYDPLVANRQKWWGEWLADNDNNPLKAQFADVWDKFMGVKEQYQKYLFGNYGASLKAQTAIIELQHALKKNKGAIERGEITEGQIAESVADLMNNDFGGLHHERLGWAPESVTALRIAFLGPDWTASNVRSILQSMRSGNIGQVHRAFWTRIALKGLSTVVIFNLLLGAIDDEDYVDRFKKAWTLGNLRFMEVDISPIYHMLGGDKDLPKYASILGHFKDAVKFAQKPFLSFQHKGSPMLSMMFNAIQGHDYKLARFTTTSELLGLNGDLGGHAVSWNSKSKAGIIGPTQLPSFAYHSGMELVPIQVEKMIQYIAGEMDGFDAITQTLGFSTQTGSKYHISQMLKERNSKKNKKLTWLSR